MKKKEFLDELEKRLQGLPKSDIADRVQFYSEMVDDRIDSGMTEEEAVADLGGTDEVVRQITNETPIVSLVKEKIKPKRRLKGFEIALIILGFPVWFPLLIVGFVLVLVLFIILWVLVIVSYSVELGLIGSSAAGSMAFAMQLFRGDFNIGYLAIATLSCGLAIIGIPLCVLATKASFKIMKSVLNGIKSKMIGGKKDV